MKKLVWFVCESIKYNKGMGFKYFIKGFIPAYREWNALWKEDYKS